MKPSRSWCQRCRVNAAQYSKSLFISGQLRGTALVTRHLSAFKCDKCCFLEPFDICISNVSRTFVVGSGVCASIIEFDKEKWGYHSSYCLACKQQWWLIKFQKKKRGGKVPLECGLQKGNHIERLLIKRKRWCTENELLSSETLNLHPNTYRHPLLESRSKTFILILLIHLFWAACSNHPHSHLLHCCYF